MICCGNSIIVAGSRAGWVCSTAWTLVLLLPAGLLADYQLAQSSTEVTRNDLVEVTLTSQQPMVGNPFTDARLTGELTCLEDSAAPMSVDGFAASQDGRAFRIRFLPTRAGSYRFTLQLRIGDKVSGFAGQFRAVESARPGIIRVDADHPFHFLDESTGKHWFWNSTTTYQILAWDDATIDASLRRLAGLGVNRIRVAICGRTRDGKRWNEPLVGPTDQFKFRMEPWIAADPDSLETPRYDTSRFNVSHYDKIDRLMRLARELDIVVSIIFYVDGRDAGVDPFGKELCGQSAEQLYYRYTIARLAAYPNLMWDVTNEWHLFREQPWVDQMGAFIKACDPYDHLVSVHGHGEFPFRQSAWADFAMFQSWDEHGGYDFMLHHPADVMRTTQDGQPDAPRPLPVLRDKAMCLAEPGVRYVVYLPQGGCVTVTLAAGDYRARWFNPRAGTFQDETLGAAGGVWTSPPAPDAEDWVLLVEPSTTDE